MTRITILAYGSRGDVQPFVALGRGLQQAGYTVRVAAPAGFESFITGRGLDFYPLPGDPAELVRGLLDQSGGTPAGVIGVVTEYAMPIALEMMSNLREASQDADAIIHSFLLTIAGHKMAREFDVPDFSTLLYPIFASTRHFPAPVFPPLRGQPALYNRLTHAIFTQSFLWGNVLPYQWLKRQHPELGPLYGWPFEGDAPTPILHGYSPSIIPPPPDWPPHVHTTGYWFLDDEDWQPLNDLQDFIAAGSPPIYIGFGSTVSEQMQDMDTLAVDALRQAGLRGVIASGWGGMVSEQHVHTEDVFWLDSAPHAWLFPQMAAVVHHGGAGTTSAGLRAGVPSILTPFGNDQPFWGRQVEALGVGPAAIPRQRLTADKLAYALRVAVTHEGIRQRAAELGERIRREDGIQNAVKVIQQALH